LFLFHYFILELEDLPLPPKETSLDQQTGSLEEIDEDVKKLEMTGADINQKLGSLRYSLNIPITVSTFIV